MDHYQIKSLNPSFFDLRLLSFFGKVLFYREEMTPLLWKTCLFNKYPDQNTVYIDLQSK